MLTAFLKRIGPRPTGEAYHAAAKDGLWDVYPYGDSLKAALVAYVTNAPENPGVAFAALSLIPFHDPATVRPVVERALGPNVTPATRWYLLNAAPYILAIGDAFYMGDGELDTVATRFGTRILRRGDTAARLGLGRAHARNLRTLYDSEHAKKPQNPDYGLALWHFSAYLAGTLDLRDAPTLEVFLSPDQGSAFANVMFALSFAANRDFLADLKDRRRSAITPEAERHAAASARTWWTDYLRAHPDGDWRPAARQGLAAAGYALEPDARSAASRAALRRALDAPSEVTRYNAYRILNDVYGTHFDLERVFMTGKYALSFLDPSGEETAAEAKLRAYWQDRLR